MLHFLEPKDASWSPIVHAIRIPELSCSCSRCSLCTSPWAKIKCCRQAVPITHWWSTYTDNESTAFYSIRNQLLGNHDSDSLCSWFCCCIDCLFSFVHVLSYTIVSILLTVAFVLLFVAIVLNDTLRSLIFESQLYSLYVNDWHKGITSLLPFTASGISYSAITIATLCARGFGVPWTVLFNFVPILSCTIVSILWIIAFGLLCCYCIKPNCKIIVGNILPQHKL